MTKKTDYLRVGLIVRPHGIKGTLKLEPETSDNSRFSVLRDAYIEIGGTYKPVKITSSTVSGTAVFINIDGVDTREKAEALRNKFLCVDRANAVKLPEGQHFIVDLIGCTVYDTENNLLGTLSDVLTRPANDVYEITSEKYVLLVPALKKLLFEVDIDNKKIVLDKATLEQVGIFEDK